MLSLNLKEKFIIFSILCIPFLIIEILYVYCLWIPDNSWFFNIDFLRIWFYSIFLIFVFIPFSEIILFKKGFILTENFTNMYIYFYMGEFNSFHWSIFR
ncbi:hypothetical protein ALNOE001_08720 [Candidatus Methanobinarius endosymbioticus]|uniref:Uncharacterized protein n=1 Tax=Candidatus Methanobinarius endosymbioticus TaxID=2006182 RepID=A0A366MBV1_9EURY|nr:hypothetical protein ALNOE001_08720 [Candidatus Methanobinarius endosymbioticus]